MHLLQTASLWYRYYLYIIFTFESLFFNPYILCLQIPSIQPSKFLFCLFSPSPEATPYLRPPSNLPWEGSHVIKLMTYVTALVGAAFGCGSCIKGTFSIESKILNSQRFPWGFWLIPSDYLPSVFPTGLNLWSALISQSLINLINAYWALHKDYSFC